MSSFAPTTSSYALFSMPLDEIASGWAAWFATANKYPVRTDLEGSADELFPHLEPLSMAVDKHLFVANGECWTSYFNNSLLGSDVFLELSRLSGIHRCTALRILKQPTATIFEAYECPDRGGEPPLNDRRSIHAAKDGKWTFGSSGTPYPFEDVSRYEAKRIRDRFTPEMLDDILKGLGAPTAPFPSRKKLRAILFVCEDRSTEFARWSFSEVQAGLPWKRD